MVMHKQSLDTLSVVRLMVLALLLLDLRMADIITYAQSWAEDGKILMAGINNNGFWSSLFLPHNGYLQTISRLTYGIALWFGLSKPALFANISAIFIRCYFVGLLFSHRINFIRKNYRIATALYFILMPNVTEGFVNITSVRWYQKMFKLLRVITRTNKALPQSILNC